MAQTIPFLVLSQNHLLFYKQEKKFQDQKSVYCRHTQSTLPTLQKAFR